VLVTDESAVRLTALDEEINLRRGKFPRRIQPDAVVRGEKLKNVVRPDGALSVMANA